MIEQFEAVSYKGLQNFCVGPLERVNLITGPNGVGKTSLAEALWLFKGRCNPGLLWNLHVQRRPIGAQSPLNVLGGKVHLRGYEQGKAHSVRFEYDDFQAVNTLEVRQAFSPVNRPEGTVQLVGKVKAVYDDSTTETRYESDVFSGPAGTALTNPSPGLALGEAVIVKQDTTLPITPAQIEQFSNVVAQGEKRTLLDFLRLMQPRIRGIEILTHQGVPSLWADTETGGMLPLEAVGGGVVRLLSLLVNFFTARGGLIIIDEIENGIHHSALPELWRQIRVLSEELDVQVVATTHSFECIQAAVMTDDSNTSPPPDFVLLRMYQKEGVPHCLTYAGEKLMAALDMGFEIR